MREFDELDRRLAEDVSQLPPAPGEMDEFSPFSFAVFYLVAGLAMRTITLHFFGLQYILPMVGAVLLYLGFRSLRRENRWFGGAYVLSALLLVWQWASTVLLATPLGAELEGGLQSQAPSVWMPMGRDQRLTWRCSSACARACAGYGAGWAGSRSATPCCGPWCGTRCS